MYSINKCFIRNHTTRFKQIGIPKGIFNANNSGCKMVWVPKVCGQLILQVCLTSKWGCKVKAFKNESSMKERGK